MSAEARAEIAAAASSVDGVSCAPYFRQSTRTGDAVVRLGRKDAASNGFGMVTVWQVWIVLPQALADAEKWIDSHDEDIRTALDRELSVTSVLPAETTFGTSTTNVVIYEGNR